MLGCLGPDLYGVSTAEWNMWSTDVSTAMVLVLISVANQLSTLR